MIRVTVDDSRIRERLDTMPPRIRAALLKKVSALTVQLATLVRRKLSGVVLQVRTGNLRGSIFEQVTDEATEVSGRVYSSGDVKYAAIHEYGGVIPAHVILPDKAKALHWVSGGKDVFARRVNMPAVRMPERSYMRSSLADMRDRILTELKEAVVDEAKK